MRRGELRRYVRPSTPLRQYTVIIVSSDGINDSPRPWLIGTQLRAVDPGDLLAIPIEGHGWAYAGDVIRIYRGWIGDRVGELDDVTMERLDTALRAALDL